MSTTTFFVVRHGQTDWNKNGRLMGISDIPLNDAGKQQADNVARYLKTTHLDLVVTSPLKRAVQTAQAIQRYHANTPLKKLTGLHERNFGILEGKSYEAASAMYPQIVLGRMWQYPRFRPPDGESLNDVSARSKRVIRYLLTHCEGKHIAIVTHGSFIRNFFAVFLDIPLEQVNEYGFTNTSLSIARYSSAHGAEAHIMNSVGLPR